MVGVDIDERTAVEAHLVISGYVGNDVEFRTTKAGWNIASFRIACTPRRRTEAGWVDRETVWMGVRCTRALADNVKASIAKGDPVIVEGNLRRESWVDAEDVRHERMLIEASSVAHDLTRGTSAFRRTPRAVSEPEAVTGVGDDDEAGLDQSEAADPGDTVVVGDASASVRVAPAIAASPLDVPAIEELAHGTEVPGVGSVELPRTPRSDAVARAVAKVS